MRSKVSFGGGNVDNGSNDGPFYWGLDNDVSNTNWNQSACGKL